jgi:hypothetical protein
VGDFQLGVSRLGWPLVGYVHFLDSLLLIVETGRKRRTLVGSGNRDDRNGHDRHG